MLLHIQGKQFFHKIDFLRSFLYKMHKKYAGGKRFPTAHLLLLTNCFDCLICRVRFSVHKGEPHRRADDTADDMGKIRHIVRHKKPLINLCPDIEYKYQYKCQRNFAVFYTGY